jgi:hypothetical protein
MSPQNAEIVRSICEHAVCTRTTPSPDLEGGRQSAPSSSQPNGVSGCGCRRWRDGSRPKGRFRFRFHAKAEVFVSAWRLATPRFT